MGNSLNYPPPVQNGQYNIGHICTRQQCEAGLSHKIAMRWIAPNMERQDYTYLNLDQASSRVANALLGLGGLVTFIPLFLLRVPREEKMMVERFGAEYVDYMRKTGRFFPKVWER